MFYFAWRNLTQNRTQFLVGVGGATLAIVLMLALEALLSGMEDDLLTAPTAKAHGVLETTKLFDHRDQSYLA